MNTHDNMEDGGTTGTPAVSNLHALEASRDGSHDDMEAGGATKAPSVRRLSAQEASRDKFRPGLADPEHHSIKGSAADADAMDIDDVVDNAPISLQIEDRASADTVEALQLVSTCTPIGGEITAYTRMSIKQLKRAIYTEQSYNNAVRCVRQGLATPLEDRNNLAGPEMANMVSNETNMATIMATDASLEVATASSPIPTKMADIWRQWQEIDDVVHYNGKIYVPQNTALRTAVISQFHDDVFAGHFGKSRTAELMLQLYDWPGAVRDIRRYCHDCVKCQKVKPSHHKPFGLLNPLPVPPELWHTVTMDFITDLPLSTTYGSMTWDSILVVVNKLTKMAHYIPVCKMMSVTDFIEVFIQDIVKHHGMPEVLVTDRDKLFTTEQWTSFCFHMRCRRNMSTAFHPQTDGQTERQNQSLKAYLRIFVDKQQEDWAKLLSCAKFSYKNLQHAATGKSPFQLNLR